MQAGEWSCAGLVDLDGDGRLEIVLAGAKVAILAREGLNWAAQEISLGEIEGDGPYACEAVDVDLDGDLDLAIVTGSGGVVALNRGARTFDVKPLPTFGGGAQARASALGAIDADGDGRLDLFVARASRTADVFAGGCDRTADGAIRCEGELVDGVENVLLRNAGAGAFEIASGTGAELAGNAVAAGAFDVNDDSVQDLVLADAARTPTLLLRRGPLAFTDETAAFQLDLPTHAGAVSFGDLDGDDRADLVVAGLGAPLVLQRIPVGFARLGPERGFRPVAHVSTGVEVEDFDNDGDLDVLVANAGAGALRATCDACEALPAKELVLYRNDGAAHFAAERAAELPEVKDPAHPDAFLGGRALATGDLDDDGVLDAVVLRAVAGDSGRELTEPWLLRGRTVSLDGGISIDAPQGARVEVCVDARCRHREVMGARSHGALHARRVHFGLGAAPHAQVTVEWPRGTRHAMGTVLAGSRVRFRPPEP